MTKLKTPLLSLDAHGTVGDAVTFQSSPRRKFSREKPDLPYSLTLKQQYQRWLYEDYAYLWTQQSVATKQTYASAGVRHHLTGFQYWMKYNLTNLPDIVAMWHLDALDGPVGKDFSRNSNHLTVYGASPATGLINGCLYFDGLNDYCQLLTNSTLDGMSEITIEFFFRVAQLGVFQMLIDFRTSSVIGGFHIWVRNTNVLHAQADSGVGASALTPGPVSLDTWHHGLWAAKDGENARLFLDGVKTTGTAMSGSIASATPRLTLACNSYNLTSRLKGNLDHVVFYNRVFTDTEAIRHSERRYSL